MDNLTEHSRVALARIFLSDHGEVNLPVDGRSIPPLERRGLAERRQPRRGITPWTQAYQLTEEGKAACLTPELLDEIHRQGRLEADRAERACQAAREKAAREGLKAAGVKKVLRLLAVAEARRAAR